MMKNLFADKSPLACLYHWEKARPDEVHFTQPIGGGKVVEYRWREIMREVRSMAAHLSSLQLPPGSSIALFGKNSAHWIMADWAIWMAGHVTVPLYPTLNAENASYILEHSDSRLLFVGKVDGWEKVMGAVPASVPIITLPLAPNADGERWDDIVKRTPPREGEPDRALDELATIVYTSGSTGLPKGVMQSFRSFNVCGTLMHHIIAVGPEDRMLSYLPLAHVAERVIIGNQSTYYGFQVFFVDTLETFVDDLRRARPTIFFSVPRLWTKFQLAVFAKLPKKKQDILFRIPILGRKVKRKILEGLGLENVRIALTGAAPLPPHIVAWYRELGLELLEAYGMSENMAYSHVTHPGSPRPGYVGTANDGVECRIAENGELLVKSPGQMMGYYKEPEMTAACYTPDGFFKTGDMGEMDEMGRLRITGRVKELFKTTKGKYVAPVPIENRLSQHPKIEAVCVCGANHDAAYALMLLSEETRQELESGFPRESLRDEINGLMAEVNAALNPHEKLEFAVVVKEPWTTDNGFLTPTMKIRRNIIEERYEPHADRWFQTRERVIWEDSDPRNPSA
jgi:long-subunit acyl-CoA synthetase (AMP-forming)